MKQSKVAKNVSSLDTIHEASKSTTIIIVFLQFMIKNYKLVSVGTLNLLGSNFGVACPKNLTLLRHCSHVPFHQTNKQSKQRKELVT